MDRTGTVEKKREQRMKQAGKFEEKVETYSSLVMLFCSLTSIFLYDIINISLTKHFIDIISD